MRRALRLAAAALAGSLLAGLSAGAEPTADLHDVKWFVHVDLIDAGAGRDLAYYEALLDRALEKSRLVLEGNQGPADVPCCNLIRKEEHSPGVTLVSFGTPGDGLDIQDAGDLDIYRSLGGSGSRGFLIDSINDCGGSVAIGCADLPVCGGPPDDDPDRVLIVTMDAEDSGVLGLVIAHERGHNACLTHVSDDPCRLMRSSVGGGCVSTSECDAFTDARQSTGGSCACHADSPAYTALDDGDACVDGAITGVCSGGLCGDTGGSAGTRLLAAGGPGLVEGEVTDDLLLTSGLTGGWSESGAFGGTVRGLAYDADADVHYAVLDVVGDDVVAQVDPTTATLSGSHTVTGHADLIALAFDPGATTSTSDDRLLALSSAGGFEDLIQIDPATGNATLVGLLQIGVTGGFQGMTYDDVNDRLYVAGFGASTLYEVDESSCDGTPPIATYCGVSAVGPTSTLHRMAPSLAFSRDTQEIYLVGHESGSQFFYERIDANTYARRTRIGPDQYTAGGLSALPLALPEPSPGMALTAGAALLSGLARRRRAHRGA
jgi:hypothetical protein